jgi:hypothetical protein
MTDRGAAVLWSMATRAHMIRKPMIREPWSVRSKSNAVGLGPQPVDHFVRLGRGCDEASLQAAREPHMRGSTRDRAGRHCGAGLDRRRDTTVAE